MEKIVKTEEEWKALLTPEQFKIARKHGTERPFTGPNHDSKEPGVYHCVACDLPLFNANTKFDSGTGWPSFFAPINKENVGETVDKSWFMTRTEVHCARCGAHLGHVFDDGPQPTGLRYCMNGTVMKLEKD